MPIVDGQIVKWAHHLKNFKKRILEEDKDEFTEEEIQAKTELFWKIVKGPTNRKFLEDFIEEWECMYKPESMNTVQDFDELMENLYDFCDYNLIWVE